MTNLTPASTRDSIPQLETTDLVLAGPGGISNAQAQALLNRVQWLEDHAITDASIALGNYAAGDLFYALGAKLLGKLGIGTAKKVLVSTGAAPSWSDSLDLAGQVKAASLRVANLLVHGAVVANGDPHSIDVTAQAWSAWFGLSTGPLTLAGDEFSGLVLLASERNVAPTSPSTSLWLVSNAPVAPDVQLIGQCGIEVFGDDALGAPDKVTLGWNGTALEVGSGHPNTPSGDPVMVHVRAITLSISDWGSL